MVLIRFKQLRYWGIFLVILACALGGAGELLSLTVDKPVRSVLTTEKMVAITIDDGPHPVTTPKILAVLRDKQVKATFFCLGSNAAKNKNIVQQAAIEGHEIGNHSYSHRLFTKLSPSECKSEIEQAESLLTTVAPKPTIFRPPGGAYNETTMRMLNENGYRVVSWSIDPRDWSGISAAKIVSNVLKDVKPGSIILLHDGQYPINTPEALSILIDKLREQGYTFVTVSQLLESGSWNSGF